MVRPWYSIIIRNNRREKIFKYTSTTTVYATYITTFFHTGIVDPLSLFHFDVIADEVFQEHHGMPGRSFQTFVFDRLRSAGLHESVNFTEGLATVVFQQCRRRDTPQQEQGDVVIVKFRSIFLVFYGVSWRRN